MNRSIWASSDNSEALATSVGDGCFEDEAVLVEEPFFPVADCEVFSDGVTPAGGKPSLARWSSIIRSLIVGWYTVLKRLLCLSLVVGVCSWLVGWSELCFDAVAVDSMS